MRWRSRTTYRPTVTPERSTLVDSFTGTTSSLFGYTAREILAGLPTATKVWGIWEPGALLSRDIPSVDCSTRVRTVLTPYSGGDSMDDHNNTERGLLRAAGGGAAIATVG